MNDLQQRILEVAARVYSEAGFRGTTTRRIADEAQVNEVTLFRHFGTKEALIKQAIAQARLADLPPLPRPADPAREIYEWAMALFTKWYRGRNLIRRVMGDLVEHPGIAPDLCAEPSDEHCQLSAYLHELGEQGWTTRDVVPEAAAGLLTGAIFTHAVWRDHLTDVPEPEVVVRQFVDLVLTSIGVTDAADPSTHQPE